MHQNPGVLISSVILKENNYPEWSTELRNSLQAKQKLGFIDGSLPKPASNPGLTSWLAANSMIIGWIRTSIELTIRSTVSFVLEASELWESLQKCFSIGNGVRKQLLRDEISACKQDGQPVLTYYGNLTKHWEELQNYKTSRVCRCEAAPDIAKEREDDRVHQFLFDLDERFRTICSSITDEDPLPGLYQVYSRVIHEEQNLNSSRSKETVKTEAIGFSVQTTSPSQVVAVSAPRFRDHSTLLCTHCNRKGHEVTECFVLYGYPDLFFEQNRQDTANVSSGRGGSSRGRGNNNRGGRHPPTSGRGRGRANNAQNNGGTDQIAQLIRCCNLNVPINLPRNFLAKLTSMM